jgi:hypothetical protein
MKIGSQIGRREKYTTPMTKGKHEFELKTEQVRRPNPSKENRERPHATA